MVMPNREYDQYVDDAFAARSKKLLARIKAAQRAITLRYDGKYDFMQAPFDRQWTVLSHWIDADGADRYKGSFSLQGLRDIGIVKTNNGGKP